MLHRPGWDGIYDLSLELKLRIEMETNLLSKEPFIERLREVGTRRYHHKHPFHVLINEVKLNPEAIRGWVANRLYYHRNIPVKDEPIISNCPVREERRACVHPIIDHERT